MIEPADIISGNGTSECSTFRQFTIRRRTQLPNIVRPCVFWLCTSLYNSTNYRINTLSKSSSHKQSKIFACIG